MLKLLLQMFGPVLASLLSNLMERAKAGWKTSTLKAGVSVAAIEALAHTMGCDVGLLEPAVFALPVALPLIFEVPSNMVIPTLLDAMKGAVEEAKTSKAVLADAQAKQDEAAKKYGIQ